MNDLLIIFTLYLNLYIGNLSWKYVNKILSNNLDSTSDFAQHPFYIYKLIIIILKEKDRGKFNNYLLVLASQFLIIIVNVLIIIYFISK